MNIAVKKKGGVHRKVDPYPSLIQPTLGGLASFHLGLTGSHGRMDHWDLSKDHEEWHHSFFLEGIFFDWWVT